MPTAAYATSALQESQSQEKLTGQKLVAYRLLLSMLCQHLQCSMLSLQLLQLQAVLRSLQACKTPAVISQDHLSSTLRDRVPFEVQLATHVDCNVPAHHLACKCAGHTAVSTVYGAI